MFWTRKTTPQEARTRQVGLDLNSSRARAVSLLANRTRNVQFEDQSEELALFVDLTKRPPIVGRSGVGQCRKAPHLVCSNFLPLLGQPKQWQSGRLIVTPEIALATTFEQLRNPLTAEAESLAIALPAYLTPVQVKKTLEIARNAKLPLVGSASTPVAIAAHRAAYLLESTPQDDERPDWVVPLRSGESGPCTIVLVDVDEYALTVSVVHLEPRDVKLLSFSSHPKLGMKAWKERLIDALSDRCVRLCRRDPRDSAIAEQALYEQLDLAFEMTQNGEKTRLTVRSEHWYQDLVHQPEEVDQFCALLSKQASESTRSTLESADSLVPPRAIWLTHSAARLPGLAKSLHENSAEQTAIQSLPPQAAADAAAWLIRRWNSGELPKAHLDGVVPLEAAPSVTPKQLNQRV
jgi:hypothetical protein